MKGSLAAAAVAVLGFVVIVDNHAHGGKDSASISVIMKKAMKGGLINRVDQGTATPEEKKELISLLTDLAAHKPPRGDEASWKEKTKALLDAAKADDAKALNKAADCTGCHNAHKIKK